MSTDGDPERIGDSGAGESIAAERQASACELREVGCAGVRDPYIPLRIDRQPGRYIEAAGSVAGDGVGV